MSNQENNEQTSLSLIEPYHENYYAAFPSKRVRFGRTCKLWQLWRFMAINLRITRLLLRSHK